MLRLGSNGVSASRVSILGTDPGTDPFPSLPASRLGGSFVGRATPPPDSDNLPSVSSALHIIVISNRGVQSVAAINIRSPAVARGYRTNISSSLFAQVSFHVRCILWRRKVAGEYSRTLSEHKRGNLRDIVRGQWTCHPDGRLSRFARKDKSDDEQHKAGDNQ